MLTAAPYLLHTAAACDHISRWFRHLTTETEKICKCMRICDELSCFNAGEKHILALKLINVIHSVSVPAHVSGEKGATGEKGDPGIGERGEPGPAGPIGKDFTYADS